MAGSTRPPPAVGWTSRPRRTEHGGHGLDGAGGARGGGRRRLWSRSRHLRRALAQRALKAATPPTSLSGVPVPCALMKSTSSGLDAARRRTRARARARRPLPSGGAPSCGWRRRRAGAAQLGERGGAPRPCACSRDSRTSTAAPSPIDMPARPSRNGRQGRFVHGAQRVEAGVGDLAERVGAAGERTFDLARAERPSAAASMARPRRRRPKTRSAPAPRSPGGAPPRRRGH